MNQRKAIICLLLTAAIMLLGGCQAKEPTASAVAPAPDKSVTLPSDFATTDEVREKGTLNGSGDNSALELSLSLYGKTYSLGESTVGDFLDNGWIKDEKSWEKIPENQKLSAHSVNVIAKMLKYEETGDKLFISYRNITDKKLPTKDCALSKIQLNGRYDTMFAVNKLRCFGGRLDLAKCTDRQSFETELKKLVSTATYNIEGYYYSTYNKYTVKLKNGTAYIVVRTDSATGRLRDIDISLILSESIGKK